LLRRRLRMVGTVNALREGCELGGVGHGESWIARGNGLDDIASGLTLVYPVTHLFAGGDGFRSAVVGDAGLVKRCQKSRVGVGIGRCRHCQGRCSSHHRKRDKRSHGLILVQIDAIVPPTCEARGDASQLPIRRTSSPAFDDQIVIVTSWRHADPTDLTKARISSAAVSYFSWPVASA
jgi:hypothetical protein